MAALRVSQSAALKAGNLAAYLAVMRDAVTVARMVAYWVLQWAAHSDVCSVVKLVVSKEHNLAVQMDAC